ncbi:MAG: CoA transferase [Gemmatimonadetes bacterium]|nr:CoA transferase [Gemmatimonadota bacterium]
MLSGIRVFDLTRVLAGPFCTMTLADMGADVIKVERPGAGDDTRAWGPPFDARGQSSYYLAINRNKKSIALDLADPADVALARSLIAESDVVVENFLPGALARRGLDADALLAAHPALIWCTIGGFRREPERPGYDIVAQGESGLMAITGEPAGRPMKHGVAIADLMTGKDAATAICAALVARSRGPRSVTARRLHLTLLETALAAMTYAAQNVMVSGKDAGRVGNGNPNLAPYDLYAARDRPFILAVGNDAQFVACARVLGRDALATDARFATNAARVVHRGELDAEIARALAERDADAWIAALERAGVPCGRVRSVREAIADAGGSPLTGMPPAVPGSVRLPPPLLDEHGAAIRALGWRVFEGAAG